MFFYVDKSLHTLRTTWPPQPDKTKMSQLKYEFPINKKKTQLKLKNQSRHDRIQLQDNKIAEDPSALTTKVTNLIEKLPDYEQKY